MSEHCEEPRNGEEVGQKLKTVQMVGHNRVLEFDENREESQIFLNHITVVSLEESLQVFVYESVETGEGLRLVVEVDCDEGSGQ